MREVLRLTMFAPTVTGSPMQNACAVIARHEQGARGYYSGVLALFSDAGDGTYGLDAPILIRTAYIDGSGNVRVPAGATLVRHSDPESEVAETRSKAAGILTAIGAGPARVPARGVNLAKDPAISEALAGRNSRLAGFWLHEQNTAHSQPFLGRSAIVVDAEDEFTAMLTHQLRRLGMSVDIVSWAHVPMDSPERYLSADLLVAGPGPGDPTSLTDPRIARMHALIRDRLTSGLPLLAVCLSHQILASMLGARIDRLDSPRQGLQLEVDVCGQPALVGFYNTFTARGLPPVDGVEASTYGNAGDLIALRGPCFASIQGHLESVLSRDGYAQLERLVGYAL